jgi:hypothetical protein
MSDRRHSFFNHSIGLCRLDGKLFATKKKQNENQKKITEERERRYFFCPSPRILFFGWAIDDIKWFRGKQYTLLIRQEKTPVVWQS